MSPIYATCASPHPLQCGKNVVLDCGIVGVKIECKSSLARVSIDNYTGAIILDIYIRPSGKAIYYRNQWSVV